jgi:hypothetical protein
MSSGGWKHLKELQDTLRDGYLRLRFKENPPTNTLADELIFDIPLLIIGLVIYIHLDIRPILPIQLPEMRQSTSTIIAIIALAIAGYGGIRIIFSLIEHLISIVTQIVKKQ